MKYKIIYADPPWSYDNKGTRAKVEDHYKSMTLEDICSIPINDISEENSVLFLWVTFPFLQCCFKVIESWGFEYKTCAFNWVKLNKKNNINESQFTFEYSEENIKLNDFMGMGNWTRANSELCLLGTKGKIKRKANNIRQVIYDPITKHSEKPQEARNRIVELMGDVSRIEIFARKKIEGWDSIGFGVDGKDINESIKNIMGQ